MSGFVIHFKLPPEIEEKMKRREPEVISPRYFNEEKRLKAQIKKCTKKFNIKKKKK
jgi:hypothetical protein